MSTKPTYKDLEERIAELEQKIQQYQKKDIQTDAKSQDFLTESETKYRNLVNNIPGTIYQFVLTPKGKFRFEHIEESCIGLFGVSAAEIMTDANFVFKLIPQPDANKVHEAIMNSAVSLTPYTVDHRIIKGNGETVWIHASSIPRKLDDGSIIWDGIGLNITKRKKVEEQLRFQSDILDCVEEAVIVTDLEGKIAYWNEFAEQLYGWEKTEVIGRSVLEITVPQISKDQAVQIMEALSKGTSWSGEFLVQNKDGKVFPAFVTDIPFFEEGKFVKVIGVSVDITDKKTREADLLDKQKELIKNAKQLEEMNTALKVLIDYREEEADDFKKSLIRKFEKIVIPYFPTSPETKTREELSTTVSILKNNIKAILFSNSPNEKELRDFSPTEARVAFMIRSGKSSKEIADSLSMSLRTVYFHRENLRKKLKLPRGTNLKTHLNFKKS